MSPIAPMQTQNGNLTKFLIQVRASARGATTMITVVMMPATCCIPVPCA